MIKLEDNGLLLRPMELNDVDSLYKWENDTSLWNVSDTISPFSKDALKLFITSSLAGDISDQLRLMICYKGAIIGCSDLFSISRVNHNASIGILLYDIDMRNRGIATKALRLLETFAKESLEIVSLKAEVSVDNIAAQRLFTKLGYDMVGTLRAWKRISNGKFSDINIYQHNL